MQLKETIPFKLTMFIPPQTRSSRKFINQLSLPGIWGGKPIRRTSKKVFNCNEPIDDLFSPRFSQGRDLQIDVMDVAKTISSKKSPKNLEPCTKKDLKNLWKRKWLKLNLFTWRKLASFVTKSLR